MIIACVLLPFVLAFAAVKLYLRRLEKENAEQNAEFEELFKPGRVITVYECRSRVFEKWSKIYAATILEYKNGNVWVRDHESGKEWAIYINDLLCWSDKVVLSEKESHPVAKSDSFGLGLREVKTWYCIY